MKEDDNQLVGGCRFFFRSDTGHVKEAFGTAAQRRLITCNSGVSSSPPITHQHQHTSKHLDTFVRRPSPGL